MPSKGKQWQNIKHATNHQYNFNYTYTKKESMYLVIGKIVIFIDAKYRQILNQICAKMFLLYTTLIFYWNLIIFKTLFYMWIT